MLQFAWPISALVIVTLVICALVLLLRRPRFKPHCLHCGSRKMVEIGRETLKSRTVEVVGGGAMAGGDVRLQLEQEVTYSCQSCGKTAKFAVTETT